MLRLFLVLMFVLVFSITVIPYSYANHDTIPSYVQNNTGWDREMFHDYDLYEFVDKFGIIIVPIYTDGSFFFEMSTNEFSYLDLIEKNEHVYNYYSTIDKNDDKYLETVHISSFYFDPENEKKIVHISFPNILNLGKFSNELNKFKQVYGYDEEIDNIILHDFIIEGFGKLKIFTSDGFFIEKILPLSDQDNTHTHIMIPQDRSSASVYSNFNGTFIDDPIPLFYDYVFSPLKQTQNGVEPQNILCKENLELISSSNDSPACVKSESIPKLVERGWTYLN